MKLALTLVLLIFLNCEAFVVTPTASRRPWLIRLQALPEVDSMRISEIRQELESYGISTKAFLEKKEMMEALKQARAEGKTPINKGTTSSTKTASGKKTDDASVNGSGGMNREERIKAEMEKANKMKTGELKEELKKRGISTKSFFEKSEFVKAYAEAVVDGVNNAAGASSARENFDPNYRDVVMQKMDKRDPRLLQSRIIDIRL